MIIKQFKYSTDNLGYLIYSETQGIAIDAGAVENIINFTQTNHIQIKYITNTHSHHDHTSGNEKLLKATNAEFIDCSKIKSDQRIHLDNEILNVFHTPGHTDDSVSFAHNDFLITGDTLFNGTIGNCFSGDLDAFFKSLKRLISFPEKTKIYCGHDYVIESMQVAQNIEKNNLYVKEYLKKYNPEHIVSTIEDELEVNPFLRFNEPGIIKNLKKQNMATNTELDRFKAIMEIY
ncbi:MBL fold metallo-hydrolase [bacterium]|nr:MBL fold metallo-hydrolase [bacterium]